MQTYWLIDTTHNHQGHNMSSSDFSLPGDTGVGGPDEDSLTCMDTLASLPPQTKSNKCVPGSNMKKKSSTVFTGNLEHGMDLTLKQTV